MKKVYTILLIVAVSVLGIQDIVAQGAQRTVLIEKGTNASCPPCASQNPPFINMLETEVPNDQILISYQWWFPGFDPMHEHNPDEVNQRFETYYGQNGVPTAMIDGDVPDGSTPGFDGSWYEGAPGGYSAQMITDRAAVPSPFEISIDYTLNASQVEATVTVTAASAVNATDLKLRIVVIEKLISFDSPPGSTSLTEFHNVMKKFMPNANGINLMDDWAPGDSETFTESWVHQNIYDFAEVAVVAFVQNDTGKEVMQAALADDGEFNSAFNNAGGLFGLTAPADICPGTNTIAPTVNLRNTGNATLTSCDITASINGVEETVNWTGSLASLEDEEVVFPAMTFDAVPGEDAELTVTVTNTNDEVNEEDVINAVSTTLNEAPSVTTGVLVEITTDNYGDETYWKITNSSGVKVAEGGNESVEDNFNTGEFPAPAGSGTYENASDYEHEVELDASDCYTFEIFDYYGDGMCCQYGNGEYTVRNLQTNQPLFSGGEFTGEESGKFGATVTSISDLELEGSLSIFPNPIVNNATIQANLSEGADVLVEVYDLTGKVVYAEDFGTQPAGPFITEIDFNALSNGMYLMNFSAGEGSAIRKLSVNK